MIIWLTERMTLIVRALLMGTLRKVRSHSGLFLACLALMTVRCGSSDSGKDLAGGDGDEVTPSDPDNSLIKNEEGMGGASNVDVRLSPLCGLGACIPERKTSCATMGGAGGAGEMALGGEAGGIAYDPGELGVQGLSCQVGVEPGCEGETCSVVRACAPSGASGVGAPCVSQADCGGGLACVGEGRSGICRPYCCQGTARSCGAGTFCDERSFPEAPEIVVPVCLPVDDCALTDPFPCAEGQDCSCKDGRACVVVRPDGETACAVPGPGQHGDPCTGTQTAECAHGFVCHPEVGCRQVCSVVASSDSAESQCPDGGACQSPPDFPSDLGICIGGDGGPVAAR